MWIWLEADEWETDSDLEVDPLMILDWRGVLVGSYNQEGVCRVDRAELRQVRRPEPEKYEVTVELDIVLIDEDEHIGSVTERMSTDWDMHNDSFEVPDPWRVSVGGHCTPMPEES